MQQCMTFSFRSAGSCASWLPYENWLHDYSTKSSPAPFARDGAIVVTLAYVVPLDV